MIRSSWVATAMYAPSRRPRSTSFDVGAVDVALLGVRDRRGLEVRPLHDAEVRAGREQPLEVVRACGRGTTAGRSRRSRARRRAAARRSAASPPTYSDCSMSIRTNVPELAGARDEPLDVLVRGFLVEGEPEVRELERDVRPQLLRDEALEDPPVLVRDGRGACFVRDRLAEQRRVRVQPCVVQPAQDADALVERLAGDEPPGPEPSAVALDEVLQSFAVGRMQESRARQRGHGGAEVAHAARAYSEWNGSTHAVSSATDRAASTRARRTGRPCAGARCSRARRDRS